MKFVFHIQSEIDPMVAFALNIICYDFFSEIEGNSREEAWSKIAEIVNALEPVEGRVGIELIFKEELCSID